LLQSFWDVVFTVLKCSVTVRFHAMPILYKRFLATIGIKIYRALHRIFNWYQSFNPIANLFASRKKIGVCDLRLRKIAKIVWGTLNFAIRTAKYDREEKSTPNWFYEQ